MPLFIFYYIQFQSFMNVGFWEFALVSASVKKPSTKVFSESSSISFK